MKHLARIARSNAVRRISRVWIAGSLALAMVAGVSAAQEPLSRSTVTVSKAATALPGPRYTWVAMPQILEVETDARIQDLQMRARLQAALDKALQAKGYQLADDPALADFIVAYRVGVRDLQEVTEVDTESVGTPQASVVCREDGCSQLVIMGNDSMPEMKVVTTDYVEGGLLIEVIEPRTIRVLWRALNKGAVKRGDGSQARLDAIAAHTLAPLPANSR